MKASPTTKTEVFRGPDKDQNVPLQLMQELYRTYDHFNKYFASGELPRPVILIQSANRRKFMGWFSADSWMLKDEAKCEITIASEALIHGYKETIDTMLHEMAHLANFYKHKKVVDCSDQQRHNKIFKVMAESFGLIVTKSTRFGFGHTKLGDKAHAAIHLLKPKEELYELYRNMKPKEDKEKKESNLAPVMIDKGTKKLIMDAANTLGITQKELTTNAVHLLLAFPTMIDNLTEALFGKKFKTKEDLKAVITATMTPPEPEVKGNEENSSDEE